MDLEIKNLGKQVLGRYVIQEVLKGIMLFLKGKLKIWIHQKHIVFLFGLKIWIKICIPERY